MRRHRIACLAFDGMAPFELATVAEVFAVSRPELDVDWWYRFELCAETPGPHRVVGGFDIVVHHGLDRLRYADTVIVPGVADVRRDVSPTVLDALRDAHARGARLVSICSGAFALASAGLLDGKEATTHWRHARLLQERHPEVAVNASVLYVDHGSIVTAAGTAMRHRRLPAPRPHGPRRRRRRPGGPPHGRGRPPRGRPGPVRGASGGQGTVRRPDRPRRPVRAGQPAPTSHRRRTGRGRAPVGAAVRTPLRRSGRSAAGTLDHAAADPGRLPHCWSPRTFRSKPWPPGWA